MKKGSFHVKTDKKQPIRYKIDNEIFVFIKIRRSFITYQNKFIYSNKYTIFRWLSNQHHQVKAKCVKILEVYTSEVKIKLKSK